MSPRRAPGRTSERGAALLMTLIVVAALSTVAVALSDGLLLAARRAANAEARDQALWHLMGAESLARQILRRDYEASPTRTTLDAPWGQPVSFPIDGGIMEGVILDRANCFNVNSLVVHSERRGYTGDPERRAELQRLAVALGLDQSDAERFAAAASDWIDGDESPIGRGAEDFDYALLEPPYRAANSLFAEVEEARALAGVGEDVFRALRRHLCAYPDTAPARLNVNTLHAEDAALLVALFGDALTLDAAKDVIAERPAGGWTSVEEFFALDRVREIALAEGLRNRVALTTDYFELEARVAYREAYAESVSLLQRTGGAVSVKRRRIGGGE
jgi:general secretion pathway protein K